VGFFFEGEEKLRAFGLVEFEFALAVEVDLRGEGEVVVFETDGFEFADERAYTFTGVPGHEMNGEMFRRESVLVGVFGGEIVFGFGVNRFDVRFHAFEFGRRNVVGKVGFHLI